MGGHRHDGAGAVAEQNVVGDEHRNALAVRGVRGVGTGEHAGLGFVLLTLQIRLGGDRAAVVGHRCRRCGSTGGPSRVDALGPLRGGERIDEFVLRRQHHVGGAEQGVGAGGEHLDVGAVGVEEHRRPSGPPDPVALHGLNLLRPVQDVEVLQQPIGVGGDPHHPLAQPFAEYRKVTALAAAVSGDFLVGQHGAQARTPVHHRVGAVDQPVRVDDVRALARRQLRPLPSVVEAACTAVEFSNQLTDGSCSVGLGVEPGVIDLQEDPLCPGVVVDVGGGEAAPLIVPESEPAQLAAEVLDVGVGAGARVRPGLHGVLLGG